MKNKKLIIGGAVLVVAVAVIAILSQGNSELFQGALRRTLTSSDTASPPRSTELQRTDAVVLNFSSAQLAKIEALEQYRSDSAWALETLRSISCNDDDLSSSEKSSCTNGVKNLIQSSLSGVISSGTDSERLEALEQYRSDSAWAAEILRTYICNNDDLSSSEKSNCTNGIKSFIQSSLSGVISSGTVDDRIEALEEYRYDSAWAIELLRAVGCNRSNFSSFERANCTNGVKNLIQEYLTETEPPTAATIYELAENTMVLETASNGLEVGTTTMEAVSDPGTIIATATQSQLNRITALEQYRSNSAWALEILRSISCNDDDLSSSEKSNCTNGVKNFIQNSLSGVISSGGSFQRLEALEQYRSDSAWAAEILRSFICNNDDLSSSEKSFCTDGVKNFIQSSLSGVISNGNIENRINALEQYRYDSAWAIEILRTVGCNDDDLSSSEKSNCTNGVKNQIQEYLTATEPEEVVTINAVMLDANNIDSTINNEVIIQQGSGSSIEEQTKRFILR